MRSVPTAPPSTDAATTAAFDIAETPYKSNTYAFTEEELWAIEDTENELERRHNLNVTKYNLVRLGIHLLVEDFRRNREDSFVVTRLRSVPK